MPYLHALGLVEVKGSHSPGFATPQWVELAAGLLDALEPVSDPSGGVQGLYGDPAGPHAGGLHRRYRVALGPGKVRVASTVTGSERDEPGPSRGEVTEWSRRSRLRMVEVMASLDWGPVVEPGPGRRPGMVTLTLPGDWLRLAPDGPTFKKLLERFWTRWARRWGPIQCVWKLEFQRRGAPHVHIYTAVPMGSEFLAWLSRAWFEAVGSGDERHLLAGTGVDWAEGIRATDPKRLAVYFLKRAVGHNLKGSQEYQHRVPVEWLADGSAGPGRFWGYKGLQRCDVEVQLDEPTYVDLRRLLRRWAKANGRPVRSLAGGRGTGGMVLANDAPGLIAQAARWLEVSGLRRSSRHSADTGPPTGAPKAPGGAADHCGESRAEGGGFSPPPARLPQDARRLGLSQARGTVT